MRETITMALEKEMEFINGLMVEVITKYEFVAMKVNIKMETEKEWEFLYGLMVTSNYFNISIREIGIFNNGLSVGEHKVYKPNSENPYKIKIYGEEGKV